MHPSYTCSYHHTIPPPVAHQAAFIAEHWARPADSTLTTTEQRTEWVERRLAAVGDRIQDTHFTSAGGACPWGYMRELLCAVREAPQVEAAAAEEVAAEAAAASAAASAPASAGEACGPSSWLEGADWDARLRTVQEIFCDRGSRMPKRPWDDDEYRRCEYTVEWRSGSWSVDDSKAKKAVMSEMA